MPPSGPIDDRSLRVANRLVGNPQGAAGIEVTLTGPRLRFGAAATVAVTGAPIPVKLDGELVDQWRALDVPAGGVLALGAIRGGRAAGVRRRRAAASTRAGDGLPVGLRRRPARRRGALQAGDLLPLGDPTTTGGADEAPGRPADGGLVGSQCSATRWSCGSCSAPTARRTSSPRPASTASSPPTGPSTTNPTAPASDWSARSRNGRGPTAGEAGLHPSNILDSAYGVGTVMLAGDMAVIVGPDGPSLGGFAAVAQVIRADRWRIGQLRAGDASRLEPVDADAGDGAPGRAAEAELPPVRRSAAGVRRPDGRSRAGRGRRRAVGVVRRGRRRSIGPLDGAHGLVTYRRAGECAVLVEFGDPVIDLRSRVRAHALAQALAAERLDGVRDLTPGRPLAPRPARHRADRHGCSARRARRARGLAARRRRRSPLPGRVVHLPLAWRHSLAERAVERYARRSGRTRRGARTTSTSSAGSTASRTSGAVRDDRHAGVLPRARTRRRLPRRAGRRAAGSAAQARHDEVHAGADVDAGQRRRDRRGVPLRLRDGGTRRLPAGRADRPDLGHDGRLRRGGFATSTSSASSSSPRPSSRTCARRATPGRGGRGSSRRSSRCSSTSGSSASTPPRSRRSPTAGRPRSRPSGGRGRRRPSWLRSSSHRATPRPLGPRPRHVGSIARSRQGRNRCNSEWLGLAGWAQTSSVA